MTATASATQSDFYADKPITKNPPVPGHPSRRFARYVLAICIGVAATLAWQSYGQATKQMIATRAPELGWSPEARQIIASWVEQLGWTKPSAGADNAAVRPAVLERAQAAAEIAPDKVVAKGSIDPQQIQQIALDVAALRQTLEQVAASQTKMAGEITNLLVTDMEIFLKIPAPPPAAASSRKSTPVAPPSPAPNRRSELTPGQSVADNFRN